VGTNLIFVRTPEDLEAELARQAPELAIVDLTTPGWDYGAFFDAFDAVRPAVPILGFTTHALARQTQPLHHRCSRVVTKETLTLELPRILSQGLAA